MGKKRGGGKREGEDGEMWKIWGGEGLEGAGEEKEG